MTDIEAISLLQADGQRNCIAAFADLGDRLLVLASYNEGAVVEKSALIPADRSEPCWAEAFITPCGCIDVPAIPKPINFSWNTVRVLTDPSYAEQDHVKRVGYMRTWAPFLREKRAELGLSIGRLAELAGVPGLSLARMEAGIPPSPDNYLMRVFSALVKEKRGRNAREAVADR